MKSIKIIIHKPYIIQPATYTQRIATALLTSGGVIGMHNLTAILSLNCMESIQFTEHMDIFVSL